jgi:hypothetical protein
MAALRFMTVVRLGQLTNYGHLHVHRKRIYGASTAGLLVNPKLPAVGSCLTTNLGHSFFFTAFI